MKKTSALKSVVAVFAASTLFACTQDVTDSLTVQTESGASVTKELPKYRTYEEALAVAQDAIGMLGESSTTRSGKPRTVNTSDVQYILNSSSTRSDDEPDTLMYVFNYEDNAGFAVVSANRATEELIAVTEQGNYVAGEETGNGGFDLYMDLAVEYTSLPKPPLNDSLNDGMEEFTQYKIFTEQDTTTYGPYLQVRWGQDWPYNRSCPIATNGAPTKAGCVATAIAQIMTYYQHPSDITITYMPLICEQTLDWNEILKHRYTENPTSQTCSQCGNSNAHIFLGILIRQIGEEVEMKYSPGMSQAESELVKKAFQTFGYTCGDYQEYTGYIARNSLEDRQLVYMRGKVDENNGHAWVLDGYKKITTINRECIKPDSSLEWIEWNRWTSTVYYNHINWGWDGDSNGYYSSNVFDVASPSQLDSGMSIYESLYNFTIELKIIPNISKQ